MIESCISSLHQIADGFDHDAGGVAGQIRQRDFFHIHNLDAAGVGAGINRAVARFALGLIQRFIAAELGEGEDAVAFAADLGDRRANGIGDREVIGLDNLGSALDPACDQDAATANNDDRHRRRARLHAIDRNRDHLHDAFLNGGDERRIKLTYGARVANIFRAASDNHISRGQDIAAEDQRLFRQFITDAARTNFNIPRFASPHCNGGIEGGCRLHQTAAAQADGIGIGHAEVGADAADIHRQRRHPREALLQDADVCRRAADINHDGIAQATKESRAAHTVGRSRSEGEHRIFFGEVGVHQRAVVLADVERRRDLQFIQRRFEAIHRARRQLPQTGVHDGGVLPLQQADAPDLARQRDIGVGDDRAHYLCALLFKGGVDRREHRRDSDGVQTGIADLLGDFAHLVRLKIGDLAPIKLMAPMRQVRIAANHIAQVIGPIHHRRQADRRRQAQADAGGRRQVLALNHRVGEMRCANHHAVDRRPVDAGIFDHRAQGFGDALRYVGGGRRLRRTDDRRAIHQDGVGVRPADIYSDSHIVFSSQISVDAKRVTKARPAAQPRG